MAIAFLILIVAMATFAMGVATGFSIAAKRAAAEHRESQADFESIAAEAHDVAARLRELSS